MNEQEKKPDAPQHNYYFFTAKAFTEKRFDSDEEAVKHGQATKDVIRVEAQRHSQVLWTKLEAKTEVKSEAK